MRETCWRCHWPKEYCWCGWLKPMPARTKLVFLMHPHEYKHIKAGTGRFAALSFKDAEIIVGIGFDENPRVQALSSDPQYKPMLLYPGTAAKNLSEGHLEQGDLEGKRLLVFLLDATWTLAKKMLRLSPGLQALPRLMFTPREKSIFVIKQQPHELCLSTLEATHELMLALEASGLDHYERKDQLLNVFRAMQDFQLACAADPARHGYRRHSFEANAERKTVRLSARRTGKNKRALFFHFGINPRS